MGVVTFGLPSGFDVDKEEEDKFVRENRQVGVKRFERTDDVFNVYVDKVKNVVCSFSGRAVKGEAVLWKTCACRSYRCCCSYKTTTQTGCSPDHNTSDVMV